MSDLIAASSEERLFLSLNRPRKLNVLNDAIIDQGLEELHRFKGDKVVIFAEGERAFCAGGDVVDVVSKVREGRDWDFFFKKEYEFDQRLHQFSGKTQAFAHGIIMGGGMGIFQACQERIASDDALLSMPEITIGFFPDVGASYFLQKAPRYWQIFMAMTGARVPALWAREIGLVDKCIKAEDLFNLREKARNLSPIGEVEESEQRACEDFDHTDNELKTLLDFEELSQFDEWAHHYQGENKFIQKSLSFYLSGSPLSKVVIWDQLQKMPGLSVSEAFKRDLFYAYCCHRGGDFSEGVRALLIDKDQRPEWNYASLSEALEAFRCFSQEMASLS